MNQSPFSIPPKEVAYHVSKKWDGGDLLSLHEQLGDDAYEEFRNRWPDSGGLAFSHSDLIHLYTTLDEAENHAAEFGGEVLVVDLSNIEWNIDKKEFPHPVVRGKIPKRYVSRFQ